MSERIFAVIENKTVVNVIVGDESFAADTKKYIEVTNGWTNPKGIDGGAFFPVAEEVITEG